MSIQAAASTPMRSFWRRAFPRFAILGGAIALALVACEAMLRLFSPGYSPLFLDIYRLESNGVLSLRPNLTRRHVTSEWNVTVETNSDGLRDWQAPRAGNRLVALAIGDSFAFGWGVELEESYLSRAEASLQGLRIVKAGIPGTGTGDQILWLRAHGDVYSPNLVLLSFFVGNDFADVEMGGVAEQFTVADGLMVKRSADENSSSIPHFRDLIEWLKRSSLVTQRAAELVWSFENAWLSPKDRTNPGLRSRDRWLWEFVKVHLRKPPPETLSGIETTLETLNEVDQWSRGLGIPLALLIIPRSFQIYGWELDEWKEAYGIEDGELDLDRPQRVLNDWARSRGVVTIDLLSAFREHESSHPERRLFFYPNGHMNAEGHRVAGEVLRPVLGSMIGPPP